MSDELRLTMQMTLINGNLRKSIQPVLSAIDQADDLAFEDVNPIATSEESISSFGSVANEGYCFLQNLDETNYIEIGFSTGVYGIKLKAGEASILRLVPGLTLYLRANTATCNLYLVVLED